MEPNQILLYSWTQWIDMRQEIMILLPLQQVTIVIKIAITNKQII